MIKRIVADGKKHPHLGLLMGFIKRRIFDKKRVSKINISIVLMVVYPVSLPVKVVDTSMLRDIITLI